MSGLRIQLFGEFRVWRGEDIIGDREWDRKKTRSLMKLLLTSPGHAFSRDSILDALWPGVPPNSSERSLRTTVGLLRKALEPNLARGPDSRYVLRANHGYAFERRPECRADAWEFEEGMKKAEAARRSGDLEGAIHEYRATRQLARGEFLADEPYEEWAMEARAEWRGRSLAALSEMSECLARKGRYTEAIEACEDALTIEKYSEELHRRLMLYRYCSGENALALKAYRKYAGMLEEQLNAVPSPGLTTLKEQMEARDVPGVDDGRRRYPKPRRPLRFPYSLSRTHFVGRDAEYALLAERLREAMEGAGGAVAVEGEAGVGKTRLVEEFLGHARSRGARTLSGRCYERDLSPPLEPVLEALEPLGVGEGVEDADHPESSGNAYRTLARGVIRASRGESVILFIDDAQWADPATLDFLTYLAKRVSGEKVLLVFTYRREYAPELSGWLDRLAERRVLGTMSLDRLSRKDLTDMVERMSSANFDGLPALADFLHRESEGNPFYAVEYLRWLIESGAVEVSTRRRISTLKSEALRESAVPHGIGSLIRSRLGEMSDENRELLELASILGRAFDLGLLRGISTRDEAETLAAIESLAASGLIVETSEGAYRFSHDKLRQTIYEGIGGGRRRALHLRVAGGLEDAGGDPAELAHHYLRAKERRPALDHLERAARKAEEKYYWRAALANYALALEVMEELPDSGEKRFDLLAARERLLEHMDLHEERAATVREMFDLAKRLGDEPRLAAVHVRRIGILAALSKPDAAEEAGREAAVIFRELGDSAGEALAHREAGYVLWTNGDHAGSLAANFRALRLHRELGDRRGEVGDVGNIAEVYRGMGNYQQALRWTEEAIRIYREEGDGVGEAMRLATSSAIHHELGDPETALPLVLRSLEICAELGVKNLLVAQHSACGTLYLSLGNPQEALAHFRSAARFSREMGYTRDEGFSTMSVGVSLERTGDPIGAVEAYRRAAELLGNAHETSGTPKELSGKADALALLAATLHRSLDEQDKALDAYQAAEVIYRKLGDAPRLRKLLLGLAGLRWRIGRLEDSARDYEEALEFAREHGEEKSQAIALASLSVVYRDLGDLRESLRRGKKARELLRNIRDVRAEAYVLSSLAESHGRLGHYPSALSCLRRSLRLRRKVGDKAGAVGVLHELAKVYEAVGDPDRARSCLEEEALEKTFASPIMERKGKWAST